MCIILYHHVAGYSGHYTRHEKRGVRTKGLI
nr:MAG TPA: hypothetical protein [Caudoviricetes sp.]